MLKPVTCLALFVSSLLLLSCNGNRKTNAGADEKFTVVRIKGSETVRPILEKAIEQFSKINPSVYIEYDGGGSNLGLMALKQQETDIAFISRELSHQEWKEIDTVSKFSLRRFGYDGLTLVVNLANPLKELNISQLRGIYAGYITNWKDVGGRDMPIIVYSRDISSGTYLFFKEHVLDSLDYTKDDINLVHNKEIIANVIQTPNAIGYVGHGDVTPNLKVLKLAAGSSRKFIEPSFGTIKSKDYPLSRSLFYLLPKNGSKEVMQVDSFLRSPTVNQIIVETGFIPN